MELYTIRPAKLNRVFDDELKLEQTAPLLKQDSIFLFLETTNLGVAELAHESLTQDVSETLTLSHNPSVSASILLAVSYP